MDSFKVYSSWIFTYYSQESFKFFISFVVGASSTGSIEFTTLLVVVVTSVFGGIFVGLEFINISSVGNMLGELLVSLLDDTSKFSNDSEFVSSGKSGLLVRFFLMLAEGSGVVQETSVSVLLSNGIVVDLGFLLDASVHFVQMGSEGGFIGDQVRKMLFEEGLHFLVGSDGVFFLGGVGVEGIIDFISDLFEEFSDSLNGIRVEIGGGFVLGSELSESNNSGSESSSLAQFNTLLDEVGGGSRDLNERGLTGSEQVKVFFSFIDGLDGSSVLLNSGSISGGFLLSLGSDSVKSLLGLLLVVKVGLDVGQIVFSGGRADFLVFSSSLLGSLGFFDFTVSEVEFLLALSLLLGSEGIVFTLFILNFSDHLIKKTENIGGGSLGVHHGSDLSQHGSHGSSGLEGRSGGDEDEGKDEEIGSHDFCELFFLV
mmetsp:Transcript_37014/g.33277  ORF Transcript_37014/g.33277 Transcript_37014/m.33277 type:complete len:427 (-) Transcript_37014:28-1308(-)